jgi:hypothetical protein
LIGSDTQRLIKTVRLKIAMKAIPLISAITLIMSLGAGFVAIRAQSQVSEAKITALVDARLAARELKLVQAWAPKYREMFMAMDESEYGKDWNPRTLEELFTPVFKIVDGMTEEPKGEQAAPSDGDKPTN